MLLLIIPSKVFAEKSIPLDAPKNVTVSQVQSESGNVNFLFKYEAAENVSSLLKQMDSDAENLLIYLSYKINESSWQYGGSFDAKNGFTFTMDPEYEGFYEKIDTNANTYYFRLKFVYSGTYDYEYAESPLSNICSIGKAAFENQYSNASSWAIPELNFAMENDLITGRLLQEKMNSPITREEFCELVVRLYERMMYKTVTFKDKTAFTDTQNPDIFKAHELGIVEGVGMKKFEPNSLTNREQIATIMHRAVKVIRPHADFTIGNTLNYTDADLVSSWALESVKFMNKNGILKGDSGKIDPKGTTTREQAIVIVKRVFEQYASLVDSSSKAVYPQHIEKELPQFFPRKYSLIFSDAEDFKVELVESGEQPTVSLRYRSYKSVQQAYNYYRDIYMKEKIDDYKIDDYHQLQAQTPEYTILIDISNSSRKGMINITLTIMYYK